MNGFEQLRQQAREDFRLVMGALAEQRDTLKAMQDCLTRLDTSYNLLGQRLQTYHNTSLSLVDNLTERFDGELTVIRQRLDRLENPPAA